MREHMRTTDRAISNLESLPGGFNVLRNLFENVHVGAAGRARVGVEMLLWDRRVFACCSVGTLQMEAGCHLCSAAASCVCRSR